MGNVVHLYIGPGSESIADLYSFASTDYMWFVGQVKTPTYKVFVLRDCYIIDGENICFFQNGRIHIF